MKNEGLTERITMTISPDELAAVEDWMFRNRIRSRSEAIRQLIALGLHASEEPPEEPSED